MADPRTAKLAKILVQYSTKVQPRDEVAIFTQPAGLPLVHEIYREVIHAGGYPYILLGLSRAHVELDDLAYILFTEGNEDQIQHINRFEQIVRSEFDVLINLYSSTNSRVLSNVDPGKQSARAKAYRELTKIFMERSASKELRWVLSMYPTDAYAQDAEMSLAEFEDYVYGAAYADTQDPVKEWRSIHDMQQRVVDWLKGKERVRVKGPHIELELSIAGRTFVNSNGTHNIPSGEIFTGPVEESVRGWVRFSYPAVTQGREVAGVSLKFEDGKVVEASAQKNQEFLLKMLDTDAGASYLGEFAIGTNKRIDRFIKNILFDEKIGGTIHMALGAGYPETGSKNESAIHWDLICDMRDGGQIFVDDELIYEGGVFLI